MPKMTTHPSRAQLSAYNLGQLPPDQATEIESHIGECEPCCDTIINLVSDDTFVGLLKETRQLPVEQTSDQDSRNPKVPSHGDFPPELAEHPRYAIVRLIGKGGMGDVYEAIHRKMERRVALKVINRELFQKTEAVNRFHREVKTAALLSHPNIVTSHDADQASDLHFMVMEYVDGVDLAKIVKDQGPLSVADACDYIRQVATGLQHAHERGMVHRDIKPHNLMVTKAGTVKILDFGLASLAPEAALDGHAIDAGSDLTAAGSIMGTPDFISPEQATDARQADIRSDIYSLGATLYFLLSGRPPFSEGSVTQKLKSHSHAEPEPLVTLRDDVSSELSAIVSKMTAKDPCDRFQTPLEVADALVSVVQQSQLSDVPEPQLLLQAGRQRNRWIPRTVIATIFLAAIFSGIVYYIATNYGTICIEVADESLAVQISGQTVTMTDGGNQSIRIQAGEKKLHIRQLDSGFEFETDNFLIRRNEEIAFKVDLIEGGVVVSKDGKHFDALQAESLPPLIAVAPTKEPESSSLERVLKVKGEYVPGVGKVVAFVPQVGDETSTTVPATMERRVALWISRDDALLVQRGNHVRLQFEGWPVVDSAGVFDGEVIMIDSSAEDVTEIRILVKESGKNSWPNGRYLREGVKAKGWIFTGSARVKE